MRIVAFFHVWSHGRWMEPLADFALHLRMLPVETVYFGVVGPPQDPERMWKTLYGEPASLVANEPAGYEWVTINALRTYARHNDGAVVYAHTKGAERPSEHNRRWRRDMIERLVQPDNMQLLEGYDAVGPYWIVDWPEEGNRFFGGNFWIATCDYLRQLPECGTEHRWVPESWLGLNNPRVFNLTEDGVHPGPAVFGLA